MNFKQWLYILLVYGFAASIPYIGDMYTEDLLKEPMLTTFLWTTLISQLMFRMSEKEIDATSGYCTPAYALFIASTFSIMVAWTIRIPDPWFNAFFPSWMASTFAFMIMLAGYPVNWVIWKATDWLAQPVLDVVNSLTRYWPLTTIAGAGTLAYFFS